MAKSKNMLSDVVDGIVGLVSTAWASIVGIVKDTKGAVAVLAIALAYYLLIGKLPEDAEAEAVAENTDKLLGFAKWVAIALIASLGFEKAFKK